MNIRYRKELDGIAVYKPGKPIDEVKRELGLETVIKLASNENPFGCSPKVKEAVVSAMDEINLYPDGNATLLKQAIATKFGVTPDMVLPSAGSDEMVDLISKSFVEPGDEIVMADITFPRYYGTTIMMGGQPVIVPLKNLAYDIEGFKKSITEKTKIVWLCNPNNPTGTMFTEKELVSLLEVIPSTTLVVYDEAYNEFATSEEYPKDSLKFLKTYKNMIVMKTLSKAYGLAGLRVGYTIGDPEILNIINKVRNPFNVTLVTQAAAMAALEDQVFLKKVVDNNTKGKEYLYGEFDAMGIEYAKTQANHIIFNAKKDVNVVFMELLKRGVIIRPQGGFETNTWLRVSIGTMEENEIFIRELKEVLK